MGMIESRARATSDPEARTRRAEAQIEKEGVEYVLLWFTDIEGHLKSFAITLAELEGALDDGMGFDGSSITGFNAIEESDMVAIPDPATFQIMPAARRRAEDRPHDLRRRQARRRAVRGRPALRAASARSSGCSQMGFDTFNVGPELEYFLFKPTRRARRRSTRAATSR